MQPTLIDMNAYPRREHFAYFCHMANPYVGLTVNVDITAFLQRVKARQRPFFLTFLYHVAAAANSVPELRQRIRDGTIVEYPYCDCSYTVALPDETYCYCRLRADMPLDAFLPYAQAEQEAATRAVSIDDGEDSESLLFISTLPWLSYTSLIQPTPAPADSNPRITWGRYFQQGDRTLIPLSILCHHAIVDGKHIARFYQTLDEQLCSDNV